MNCFLSVELNVIFLQQRLCAQYHAGYINPALRALRHARTATVSLCSPPATQLQFLSRPNYMAPSPAPRIPPPESVGFTIHAAPLL